jgi:hypothetical protein
MRMRPPPLFNEDAKLLFSTSGSPYLNLNLTQNRMQRAARLEEGASMLLGACSPALEPLPQPTPLVRWTLCYLGPFSILFMHETWESKLYSSLCCPPIESRHIHDEYCIRQAISAAVSPTNQGSATTRDSCLGTPSHRAWMMCFLEEKHCH